MRSEHIAASVAARSQGPFIRQECRKLQHEHADRDRPGVDREGPGGAWPWKGVVTCCSRKTPKAVCRASLSSAQSHALCPDPVRSQLPRPEPAMPRTRLPRGLAEYPEPAVAQPPPFSRTLLRIRARARSSRAPPEVMS